MKKFFSLFAAVLISTSLIGQNVNIPDANFKSALLGNTSTNPNGDSEIQISEANGFTGALQVPWNNITDLTGIEEFTSMTELNISNNQITTLDLSFNSGLTAVNCQSNQLTSIDISNQANLTTFFGQGNLFTEINVANGNNVNMTAFFVTNNPNLTCIEVDDVAWATANWTTSNNIDATASFSTDCGFCTVPIPDANFKAYLVGNTAINTNGDTEIQCVEASAFNGTINCSNLSISDLTGIEFFTSLTILDCSDNSLTFLDVTNNEFLESLTAENNSITTVDISNCTNITTVNIQNNNVSNFIKGTNIVFGSFYATNNSFTSIDLSDLPSLHTISVQNCSLTSINVSNTANLAYLYISNNSLTTIDLSTNVNLESLTCVSNQFDSFDFSSMPYFGEFIGTSNQLTSLNIANGNNANIATNYFKIDNNPNLNCVQVDNETYSNTNWTIIDPSTNFSTNCSLGTAENFSTTKISIYPNPSKSQILIQSNLELLNITVKNISGQIFIKSTHSKIDLSSLASGIFLVEVETENGIEIIKILKQ